MTTRAVAYSRFWRGATAALTVLSRGSLLGLAVALVFFETPLDNPLRLLRTFVMVSLAPDIGAWFLARAFAATLAVADGVLVVQRRDQRIEIACAAIAGVLPWIVPIPGGGVWLRLRSGRRFQYGVQVADPVALIEAVARAGAPETVTAAAHHPAALYARSLPRPTIATAVLKFVILALVPAVPLFRLHQWIAYGGTFGEYYTYGLQAYLLGFAIYWATFAVYLVLWAAVLRAAAEIVMVAIAWARPDRIARMRSLVERSHWLLYLGGLAAFLIGVAIRA
jgi:apolipoprotein N-acyltransferase